MTWRPGCGGVLASPPAVQRHAALDRGVWGVSAQGCVAPKSTPVSRGTDFIFVPFIRLVGAQLSAGRHRWGQHGTGDSRCRARCGRRGAKGTFETEADKWKLSPGRLARPPASVHVSPEGAKQQRVVFTSLGRQAEYTAVRSRSSSSFQTQATVEPEGRVTNLTAASWAHAALCPTPRPGVCRSPGPVLGSERTSEALSFLVPVSMTAEGLSPPGHCLGPRILTSEMLNY